MFQLTPCASKGRKKVGIQPKAKQASLDSKPACTACMYVCMYNGAEDERRICGTKGHRSVLQARGGGDLKYPLGLRLIDGWGEEKS